MKRKSQSGNALDLVQIQAKLEQSPEKRVWRGLEELAGTADYRDYLATEFPHDPRADRQGVSRRSALKLMGASAALAGLTACTKLPVEKIVPYAQQQPEDFVPGKPLFYATAMPLAGYATGLLVESHMGRPTKVEGNPTHPASLGAANVFAQASVLGLYDPDRAQVVSYRGRIGDWSKFLTSMDQHRAELLARKGAGLRILTGMVTSPSLADQIKSVLAQFPQAKWHQYEPCNRDTVHGGAKLAFSEFVNPVYHLDQADVIVSLDADFLSAGPGAVRYAHDFADKRRVTGSESTMNRLYVVESTPTSTGAMADHRLPMYASLVEFIAGLLLSQLLGRPFARSNTPFGRGLAELTPADWLPALARDLQSHRGSSLVIAGEQQPAPVHALAHALNDFLGNVGKTVHYTDPVEANPVYAMESLKELVADIQKGEVDTLFILGVNPVYNVPADLHFKDNLLKVRTRIHLSLYEDETAEQCHWHIPETHFLEAWGDARAYDGTISIIQPLISPLYDGKSAHEILAVLGGQAGTSGHDIVRAYWQRQKPGVDFEQFWQTSLNDGVVANSSLPPKTVTVKEGLPIFLWGVGQPSDWESMITAGATAIVFRPDPSVGDGSFANNGWLQEVPKPLTKLTWDNAALISPATAHKLGVTNGDVVKLTARGQSVEAPIWMTPGHADDSVTLHLGYGRTRAGHVGTKIGFNAYLLSHSDNPWMGIAKLEKTGKTYQLVTTQHHHIMGKEGEEREEESVAALQRKLVRGGTLEEFRKDPSLGEENEENGPSMYPRFKYEGNSWGMSIDLNSCIGCNACVVACQSENNIPVVGKEQVARGREMHWIRIDTYFEGGLENPGIYNQAVPCMHCENAPCVYVCPVGPTVHSPEGLNEMIYNRCVGTRYCSNNCPYKVRRFNFQLFSDWTTPSLEPLRNPDVTVRSRGVMEKCTYCIQRINKVKLAAEKEDRELRDGEILTACQQTCPAQAIVFGNINDKNSRVAKLKAQPRNYGLLEDVNTQPRTTYLAKLRNPNPEIKE
ncbi:MAG: TAT-variant-translocated molybdopterin oxidoreductase [Acidobacteriota bacterium]|nr:TAT-variant-translocated molybdopterin oxidoreductase [Acidobacteriota bacterium]